MIGECAALGGVTPETIVAMNRVGGMVLGAIESHQQLVLKHPQGAQHAVWLKTLKDLPIHRIEVTGHERIEEGADLIMTGHLLHTKQGTGVILPLGLLELTLVLQKRRRLGVKDTKGAQGCVFDGVAGIWSWFAMVRHLIDSSVQEALERVEA